jgi:hypothetical protein
LVAVVDTEIGVVEVKIWFWSTVFVRGIRLGDGLLGDSGFVIWRFALSTIGVNDGGMTSWLGVNDNLGSVMSWLGVNNNLSSVMSWLGVNNCLVSDCWLMSD